jgi:phage repressor protein C with HTH and peptisase S24 domain
MLPALLESTLELGAEARFEVDGRSMLPLIRPGDVVRVRGSGGCAARVGDVVALRGVPGGNLLVHRVVGRRGQALLLRGDNTTCPDGEYAESDILGVVCSVERGGRDVWFGAGRWGGLVARVVRAGLVCRFNRLASYARRRIAG